jgi:hypothetical protein
VIRILLDVGTLSALVNTSAAFACIWMMQAVTSEAGFGSPSALIKLLHRFSYGLLSIGLFSNAAISLSDDSDPRFIDLLVQCLLLLVMTISVVRHILAKPLIVVQGRTGLVTAISSTPSDPLVKAVTKAVVSGQPVPLDALKGDSMFKSN